MVNPLLEVAVLGLIACYAVLGLHEVQFPSLTRLVVTLLGISILVVISGMLLTVWMLTALFNTAGNITSNLP